MSADNDNDDLPEDRPEANGAEGMAQELSGLRAEVEALKDRALRALAEVENVRKRLERERDDARTYSVTRFARDMLTVADNLNRALAAFPPRFAPRPTIPSRRCSTAWMPPRANSPPRSRAMASNRSTPRASGSIPICIRRSPRFRRANSAPGTVVSVVQPGYLIGDRLLRPAMVTVAKAGGAAPSAGNGAGEGFDRRA